LRTKAVSMNLSIVSLALAGLLGAQEARQGPVVPVQQFESPMVVELPLVVGPRGVWTSAWRTPEEQKRTRRFICDRVYVYDLTLKVEKPSRDKDAEIGGRLTLAAGHGEDRRVDVLAEIVDGDAVLSSSKINSLKVEEDERSTRPLVFHITESQLAATPSLKLRLTLEVWGPTSS
jgi:hypothetical protein